MEAKTINSLKWDDYFPVLNKIILSLLLIGAILIATGVDVVQLGGKLLSGGNEIIAATDAGELVESPFAAKPTTGLAAWHNTIVAVAMMLGVVVLVLYILTVGGRDAERTKAQTAAHKKDRQPLPQEGKEAQPVSEECNLATYKMFYPSESAAGEKA
ncbi:MAG: hypothetical protein V4719_27950 [Planctomycetota bacterium]